MTIHYYLRYCVGAKPGSDRFLVHRLPHKTDLMDAVLGRLVVQEPLHDCPVLLRRLLLPLLVNPPASAQSDVEQCPRQHHLTTPEHAAPALVTPQPGLPDGGEIFPVRHPGSGAHQLSELGHIILGTQLVSQHPDWLVCAGILAIVYITVNST